jgi:hypothetical protein
MILTQAYMVQAYIFGSETPVLSPLGHQWAEAWTWPLPRVRRQLFNESITFEPLRRGGYGRQGRPPMVWKYLGVANGKPRHT